LAYDIIGTYKIMESFGRVPNLSGEGRREDE